MKLPKVELVREEERKPDGESVHVICEYENGNVIPEIAYFDEEVRGKKRKIK